MVCFNHECGRYWIWKFASKWKLVSNEISRQQTFWRSQARHCYVFDWIRHRRRIRRHRMQLLTAQTSFESCSKSANRLFLMTQSQVRGSWKCARRRATSSSSTESTPRCGERRFPGSWTGSESPLRCAGIKRCGFDSIRFLGFCLRRRNRCLTCGGRTSAKNTKWLCGPICWSLGFWKLPSLIKFIDLLGLAPLVL